MDATERQRQLSKSVSEGMNFLGLILCDRALHQSGLDPWEVLREWERDYAPVFRQVSAGLRSMARARVEAGLVAIARAGRQPHPDASDLPRLRLSLRELLAGFGVPLPELASAEAEICELHGSSCPLAGKPRR